MLKNVKIHVNFRMTEYLVCLLSCIIYYVSCPKNIKYEAQPFLKLWSFIANPIRQSTFQYVFFPPQNQASMVLTTNTTPENRWLKKKKKESKLFCLVLYCCLSKLITVGCALQTGHEIYEDGLRNIEFSKGMVTQIQIHHTILYVRSPIFFSRLSQTQLCRSSG